MIGKKVLASRSVTLSEVNELLKERKKEKGEKEELNYEQDLTLKYSKKFGKLSLQKAQKLFAELSEIQGLSEDFRVKLVDILPKEIETLRVLVPKNQTVPEETLTQILEIIKKYL